MNTLTKLYIEAKGGQTAGKLELAKTSLDDAREYAESKIDNLDDKIPNFDSNYEHARKLVKLGKTKRKDMPVISSRDIEQFQHKLMSGSIDIHAPFADDTDKSNPFPAGLNKSMADTWLSNGLRDGDKKDDVIKVVKKKINVGQLKMTQEQVYFDKAIDLMSGRGRSIESTISFLKNNTFFITSNDNFIIDGHHRFLSAILLDKTMKVSVIQIDLPLNKLLPMSLSYGDVIGNKRNK